jgi:hypothetical protein
MKSPFHALADRMNSQEPAVFQSISGHNDAIAPLQVEGSLSEKEWESLTDVSSAEAEAALKQWKKAAPEQFEEILEATEDE